MTYQETIDQFMSDGAYRIGEIGSIIDDASDDSNSDHENLKGIRRQLSRFMSILRHTTMTIIDGTNFLGEWTEMQVLREIEYLRDISSMNSLPIINFLNYTPGVLIMGGSIGSSPGSASFPEGSPGDSIFYNISGNPVADSISSYGGWGGESMTQYFTGRP